LNRHQFLSALHKTVRPRTYLETGVNRGESLTLSRVPSIGVDPDFAVSKELLADIHLARTTSDEFFARPAPLAHFAEPVIDLAFIDGMHLAEYALRDFVAIERFTTPASVIVLDDMLPRSVDEAARYRHTTSWTGDVYKAIAALREMRPDLLCFSVDTAVTGVGVVLLPDAGRNGVLPGYDDWLDTAISPDPQPVPEEVLTRTQAVDPQKLLASSGWAELVRQRTGPTVDATAIRSAFADVTS
jgi:hypothetical protein